VSRLAPLWPARGVPRLLAVSTLVSSLGFGAFNAGSAVFFTRSVGIPATTVGVGLAVTGVAALVAALPAGQLADRIGVREAVAVGGVVDAVLVLALLLVHDVTAFLVLMGLVGLFGAISDVGRQALIAGLVAADERVRLSAYLRSVLNLGITGGALLAGVVVALDTRPAYVALVAWNAAARLATAGVALRMPRVPPSPVHERGVRRALRDRPYLALAVVCGLVRTDQAVLSVALPLWVVAHTTAPRVMAGWLLGVNTLLVVAFQVRASRGAETIDGARRLQRRACLAIGAACLVIGAAGSVGRVPAVAVLVAGVAVLTVGELWESAAEWAFRFDLADPAAQGRYSGMFQLGSSIDDVIGPPLATFLTSAFLLGGWTALALLFAVLAVVSGLAVDRAVATRPASWALSTG
jgi:MFS family permease